MSAAPKSRLGRGLGGLIAAGKPAVPAGDNAAGVPHAPAPAAPSPLAASPGYLEIAVHLIEPSPYQARREIAAEHLTELAESIRSEGLLQPIVVRKAGEKFQLIAGERRWRAFQLLKIKSIPARRIGRMEELDAPFLLLESGCSPYLTGAILTVDASFQREEEDARAILAFDRYVWCLNSSCSCSEPSSITNLWNQT